MDDAVTIQRLFVAAFVAMFLLGLLIIAAHEQEGRACGSGWGPFKVYCYPDVIDSGAM